MNVKKLLGLGLVAISTLTLVACGDKKEDDTKDPVDPGTTDPADPGNTEKTLTETLSDVTWEYGQKTKKGSTYEDNFDFTDHAAVIEAYAESKLNAGEAYTIDGFEKNDDGVWKDHDGIVIPGDTNDAITGATTSDLPTYSNAIANAAMKGIKKVTFKNDAAMEAAVSYTHEGYLSFANIERASDGANLKVTLDEYFLPYDTVDAELYTDLDEVNFITYAQEVYKKDTDGKFYLTTINDAGEIEIAESRGAKTEIKANILKSESNMSSYVESVMMDIVKVSKEATVVSDVITLTTPEVATTTYGKMTKRGSEYGGTSYDADAKFDELEAYFEALFNETAADKNNFISFEDYADTTAGVTTKDKAQYAEVILRAAFKKIATIEETEAGTYTSFLYSHGGYVTKAVVTIDANSNFDVSFDELFLPHSIEANTTATALKVGELYFKEVNGVFIQVEVDDEATTVDTYFKNATDKHGNIIELEMGYILAREANQITYDAAVIKWVTVELK